MATNDTMPSQIRDGDNWFLGFASRLDPGNLPEKMLQSSKNMRLQRGTATLRQGAQRLNGFNSNALIGQLRSTSIYTDPDTGDDYILMVLGGGIMLCYQNGATYKYIPFEYSTNVNPVGTIYPSIEIGTEVQAIQALNRVYVLRGSATTPAAAVTFTNAAISSGTWGTFTVIGFPWRKFTSKTYTTNVDGNLVISLPNDHGLQIDEAIQIYSPVSATGSVLSISNTSITLSYPGFNPSIPATGTVSFIRLYDVIQTELIIQCAHEPRLNGTYPIQNSSTITTTGNVVLHYYNNSGTIIPAHTNQVGMTALQAKSPIVWDGVSATASPVNQTAFMTSTTANVPPADFGIYFQNRLVLKTSDHYIAVSDILSDTFDMQLNNFNINLGSGDDIIGFLPWIESQFLVFMRSAIYIAFVQTTNYISGPPGVNSSITVVTNEVGCLSRRSIVNAGQFVFFLSPKGVHMLTPQLDLKLIGNTQPLSEPIADFFDQLNYNTAYRATAAYYANRFYIAIPWKGSAYNSLNPNWLFNNRVAVFNTLNQQWESIDSYQSDMFIDEFFTCAFGNQKRLMAGCRIWAGYLQGDAYNPNLSPGVALLDQVSGFDQWTYVDPAPTIQSTAIPGIIQTREYTFDSISEKRYTRAQVQTGNVAGDRVQITARTYDPDAQEVVMDYTFQIGDHTTLRPRVASRGSAIDLEIAVLAGSPSIRAVEVTAVNTDRPMITQE
jgi:hypothetical protein